MHQREGLVVRGFRAYVCSPHLLHGRRRQGSLPLVDTFSMHVEFHPTMHQREELALRRLVQPARTSELHNDMIIKLQD